MLPLKQSQALLITALLFVCVFQTAAFRANAQVRDDSLLKNLLAKSKLVVVGRIVSPPIGLRMSARPVTTYDFQFKIAKILYGVSQGPDQISAAMTRPFTLVRPSLPWLSKGATCILFLTAVVQRPGSQPIWVSADTWFGVEPYSADLEQTIVRLTNNQSSKTVSSRVVLTLLALVYMMHRNQGSMGPNGEMGVWTDLAGCRRVIVSYPLIVYATTFLFGRTDCPEEYSVNAAGQCCQEQTTPFGAEGADPDLPTLNPSQVATLRGMVAHLPLGVPRPPVRDLLILSARDGNAWITRDYDLRWLPPVVVELYRVGQAALPTPQ